MAPGSGCGGAGCRPGPTLTLDMTKGPLPPEGKRGRVFTDTGGESDPGRPWRASRRWGSAVVHHHGGTRARPSPSSEPEASTRPGSPGRLALARLGGLVRPAVPARRAAPVVPPARPGPVRRPLRAHRPPRVHPDRRPGRACLVPHRHQAVRRCPVTRPARACRGRPSGRGWARAPRPGRASRPPLRTDPARRGSAPRSQPVPSAALRPLRGWRRLRLACSLRRRLPVVLSSQCRCDPR